MSTRLIQPGARRVADAAFPNASFPETLDARGFVGFAGYLSSPTSNGKNWSPARLAWFEDFPDIGLIMFCEQFETIVLQGYSAANVALARQCELMADSFGYPKDCPMWYAVDTSPFGHEDEIVEAFRAYKDNSSRPLGAYAGSHMIDRLFEEGLIEYGHIPSAASWSETSAPQNGTTVVFGYRDSSGRVHNMYITPRAHMRQWPSEAFSGSRIDANDVLRPFPAWFPYKPEEPPIDPEEDMALTDEDKAWIHADTFNTVLGLWREQEVHNYLVMHTAADLAQIAAAVVAALPASAGVDVNAIAEAVADELHRRTES